MTEMSYSYADVRNDAKLTYKLVSTSPGAEINR